jgi:hypothetical protein
MNEIAERKCIENSIRYYRYIGEIYYLNLNYQKSKSIIEVINKLDFDDYIKTRAILNKSDFSTKEIELDIAIEKYEKHRITYFKWLDELKDPYFFILNPIYNYGCYKGDLQWRKENFTGLCNLDIAVDYAKYKLNN